MTELTNKVAIITGSTSGIGEAIAIMLSQQGVSVVINSVSSVQKGEKLAASLPNSIYCQADIANESDCRRLIDTTVSHYGRLDFLINNAGAPGLHLPNDLMAISNYMFMQSLSVNVVGTWCLIREAIPHLKQTKDGVIVNITSCAGSNPATVSSGMPYAVAKSAVDYLTRFLAKELGPEIRVNAVAPGLIKTPRTENFDVAIQKFETRTPLKRTGEPNDIAELVLALIKSNYINGEIVLVDGGFSTF